MKEHKKKAILAMWETIQAKGIVFFFFPVKYLISMSMGSSLYFLNPGLRILKLETDNLNVPLTQGLPHQLQFLLL